MKSADIDHICKEIMRLPSAVGLLRFIDTRQDSVSSSARIETSGQELGGDGLLLRRTMGIDLKELDDYRDSVGFQKFSEALQFLQAYKLVQAFMASDTKAALIGCSALGREIIRLIAGREHRILLIHGHDELNLLLLQNLLRRDLGLPEPIIMGQEIIPGATLPEKFEELASRAGLAIALLTPDDEGKAITEAQHRTRARQNTLIEIGWFWGRLGRSRILILVKSHVDIPSDLQGVEYHQFNSRVTEVSDKITAFVKLHS